VAGADKVMDDYSDFALDGKMGVVSTKLKGAGRAIKARNRTSRRTRGKEED